MQIPAHYDSSDCIHILKQQVQNSLANSCVFMLQMHICILYPSPGLVLEKGDKKGEGKGGEGIREGGREGEKGGEEENLCPFFTLKSMFYYFK